MNFRPTTSLTWDHLVTRVFDHYIYSRYAPYAIINVEIPAQSPLVKNYSSDRAQGTLFFD